MRKLIVIIGAGLAGLEAGRSLKMYNMDDFVILEKNNSIIHKNSWKTFPNVVDTFDLEDCVSTKVNKIYFRAVNVLEKKILSNNAPDIDCCVLDSEKVYSHYQDILSDHILMNTKVINVVINEQNQYEVSTTKGNFTCDYLIDASGANSILDKFFDDDWFKQKAFYLCYAKRYTNSNTKLIKNDAFFDFDDPKKFCGCWCYPFSDGTAEIGVARFTNEYGISKKLQDELDEQIEQYKKLPPFNKVFTSKSVQDGNAISGFCALLPRINIQRDNRFYIGDTKGAVTYSGYGTENALVSGRKVAESIVYKKQYDYFVTPPSAGLGILKLLWNLNPDQLKKQAEGISMLSTEYIQMFFQGNINLGFFIKANSVSKKLGNNLIKRLPNDMIFRILLNRKPIKKDYDEWID